MSSDKYRAQERGWKRARWDARHAGHHITTTPQFGIDGQPYRQCLTCRGEVDSAAVLRAVAGDPPARLKVCERREAVVQLHSQLSVARIAEMLRVTDRTIWRDLAASRAGASI